MKVLPIKHSEMSQWCLSRHYAKRIPPITYAFGLYENGFLVGVVSYGVPASSSLRAGVCGDEYIDNVIELNRLCIDDLAPRNSASKLVSGSIKGLPKPLIIVSYADTGVGHIGYIYQATNFIYTGLSAKRTDWKIKGMEHLHGATVADMSRGHENRAEYMRERFGDDFYLEERSRKHRYIYFHGSKTFKKKAAKALNYEVEEYPKGESERYDSSGFTESQGQLFG